MKSSPPPLHKIPHAVLAKRNGICYNPYTDISCGYGGIGRRARFRILCRKVCRFDPCYPHHRRGKLRYLRFFATQKNSRPLRCPSSPIKSCCASFDWFFCFCKLRYLRFFAAQKTVTRASEQAALPPFFCCAKNSHPLRCSSSPPKIASHFLVVFVSLNELRCFSFSKKCYALFSVFCFFAKLRSHSSTNKKARRLPFSGSGLAFLCAQWVYLPLRRGSFAAFILSNPGTGFCRWDRFFGTGGSASRIFLPDPVRV